MWIRERKTHTCSCPASGNHNNTGRWSTSPWCCICSRKACCVGVGVKGQTVALRTGKLQQSQVVSSTLTLELPVNHDLLQGESLIRGPNTHHVPGWIAAKPGGGRREGVMGERGKSKWIYISYGANLQGCIAQLWVWFTCWHSMQRSQPSRDWSECHYTEDRHLHFGTEATLTPARATWSWERAGNDHHQKVNQLFPSLYRLYSFGETWDSVTFFSINQLTFWSMKHFKKSSDIQFTIIHDKEKKQLN